MATKRGVYTAAREAGLSRNQAKNIGTLEQLEGYLSRPIEGKHQRYSVAPPTIRLQENPYRYHVKLVKGGAGERRTVYTTVVSDVPLSPNEIFDRARSVGISHGFETYSYEFFTPNGEGRAFAEKWS